MSSMLKRVIPASALFASVAMAATYQVGVPQLATPPLVYAPATTPLAPPIRPAIDDPAIAAGIAEWDRLRQSDRYAFSAYAAFLLAHQGWPGEAALRRAAERAIAPDMESPAQVAALLTRDPPLTNVGRARLADALLALGRIDEARAAARAAWTGGALSSDDEARLLGRFGGALGPADHDRRMERLLWDGATAAAARQLVWTSATRRPTYAARLALQLRQPDADAQARALGPEADGDAGFAVDRVHWLRDTGQSAVARAYLAQPRLLRGSPFDAEKWLETLLETARAAAADQQWNLAWTIASQVDSAFPAGTSVRDRTLGERDDYTSLAWLAGTTALQKLGRPADAIGMFRRYALAAKSPQTQAKGFYWAGRAAQAAGRSAEAADYFGQAATHFDQFYGQLAAERIGVPVPAPAPPQLVSIGPADRAAFNASELVRAARWLGQSGSWQDQSLFVRAIAASVERDTDHLLAAELARDIARPDLGVMVARAARYDGSSDYVRSGFPQVPVPASLSYDWTMIHAIMRQESQFDREAVSHAGARGMMQLMPGTAREQAGKSGLPYEYMRLTSDPTYNMTLGTGYFGRMMDQFSGSYVLSVAAYNAGPGNVRKWLAANGDPRMPGVDVIDWIEAIPLSETRGYVQRVLENAVVYDLLNPERARMLTQHRLTAYLGQRNAGCGGLVLASLPRPGC